MPHKGAGRSARIDPDWLFDTLRDRICLLDYPPGAVLGEAALAREFGVSRTPIRAVLQRLAQDGLIEPRDGVGTIVTAPDFAEIRDIYLMRQKIAALIGEMAPRSASAADVAAIDALIARTRAVVERFEIGEYWRINHDKHFLVARVIGNRVLAEMWDRLYFQAARMWYGHARRRPDGVAEALLAELAETRTAFARDDALAIGFVQRNHIAYGLQRLEREDAARGRSD